MPATLMAGQLAQEQRPGGPAHDGRSTLPLRSAARQQPACSRCAGDGKPQVLRRGTGVRSQNFHFCPRREFWHGCEFPHGAEVGFLDEFPAEGHNETAKFGAHFLNAVSVATEESISLGVAFSGVVVVRVADLDFHDYLLGFGLRCATHERIIEHHAPIAKSFLQQIYEGGSKPSNAGGEATGAALCDRSPRP